MIRIEHKPDHGETMLVMDEEGIENLRRAVEDCANGGKVFMGDPGAMLILRPVDWEPGDS